MNRSSSLPPDPLAREGQLRSAFTVILEGLCGSCSGALAAVVADEEGECVDLAVAPPQGAVAAAATPGYLVKLCAAHWQIVMGQLAANDAGIRQLWIDAMQFGYLVHRLHGGYVLVLMCRPRALATVSWRALRQCEVELALEAGWPVPDERATCWTRTRIKLDGRGKPTEVCLAGRWIGDLGLDEAPASGNGGTGGFERRYVPKANPAGKQDVSAAAIELVREPTGLWYAGCSLATLRGVRDCGTTLKSHVK